MRRSSGTAWSLIIAAAVVIYLAASAVATAFTGEQALDRMARNVMPVASTAAEASHVLKSTAGSLYTLQVTSGATAGFLMLFDAAAAPADGAVTPAKCYNVPANNTLALSWNPGPPLGFSTGIVAVFSSTGCFTKTASATAYFSAEVR